MRFTMEIKGTFSMATAIRLRGDPPTKDLWPLAMKAEVVEEVPRRKIPYRREIIVVRLLKALMIVLVERDRHRPVRRSPG